MGKLVDVNRPQRAMIFVINAFPKAVGHFSWGVGAINLCNLMCIPVGVRN
jgi:hypothetical protein